MAAPGTSSHGSEAFLAGASGASWPPGQIRLHSCSGASWAMCRPYRAASGCFRQLLLSQVTLFLILQLHNTAFVVSAGLASWQLAGYEKNHGSSAKEQLEEAQRPQEAVSSSHQPDLETIAAAMNDAKGNVASVHGEPRAMGWAQAKQPPRGPLALRGQWPKQAVSGCRPFPCQGSCAAQWDLAWKAPRAGTLCYVVAFAPPGGRGC